MVKTLEVKINHLIALGILGRADMPIKYIRLRGLNILGETLELMEFGLVNRTGANQNKNDDNSFYELTRKGRKYLDELTKYATKKIR